MSAYFLEYAPDFPKYTINLLFPSQPTKKVNLPTEVDDSFSFMIITGVSLDDREIAVIG